MLNGGADYDYLYGGTGSDTASYAGASAGVSTSIADSLARTGDAQWDEYDSIENLEGSSYADWLEGDAGVNVLNGGWSSDQLLGDAGNDTLIGGAGADKLFGGTGYDAASYSTSATGVIASLANSSATPPGIPTAQSKSL